MTHRLPALGHASPVVRSVIIIMFYHWLIRVWHLVRSQLLPKVFPCVSTARPISFTVVSSSMHLYLTLAYCSVALFHLRFSSCCCHCNHVFLYAYCCVLSPVTLLALVWLTVACSLQVFSFSFVVLYLTLSTLNYFCTDHGAKQVPFNLKSIMINVLTTERASFEYICYGSGPFILLFQCRDRP